MAVSPGSIVQNYIEQQAMELQSAVVVNETQFPEAVHEKADSRTGGPMQPSEHLAKIVGTGPLPRTGVTKKIWAHIKKHKLQNPKNKREILADDKL
jgi:chromatin remodeling complex protein RSC6